MAKTMKSWLQISMKLFNFFVGMAGMTMIMYGLWLIKVWQSDTEESYSDHQNLFPWYLTKHNLSSIFRFLGQSFSLVMVFVLYTGLYMLLLAWESAYVPLHVLATLLLTLLTHISSLVYPIFHASVMSLLLFVEIVMMAHIFLNDEWEKDLGNDPSGRFRDYMESNMDICKWVGVSTVMAQGVSISLATIMKTMKIDMDNYYDIEADYAHPHLPYLNTPVQQLPTLIGGPYFAFEHYL